MSHLYTPKRVFEYYEPLINQELGKGFDPRQIQPWIDILVKELCPNRDMNFQDGLREILAEYIRRYIIRKRACATYTGHITVDATIKRQNISGDPCFIDQEENTNDWIPILFHKKCWDKAKETLITYECRLERVRAKGGHKAYAEPVRFAEPEL